MPHVVAPPDPVALLVPCHGLAAPVVGEGLHHHGVAVHVLWPVDGHHTLRAAAGVRYCGIGPHADQFGRLSAAKRPRNGSEAAERHGGAGEASPCLSLTWQSLGCKPRLSQAFGGEARPSHCLAEPVPQLSNIYIYL